SLEEATGQSPGAKFRRRIKAVEPYSPQAESIRGEFRRRERVLRELHFHDPSHKFASRAIKVGDEL
ncbi:MAG: hypothetical protein KF747_21260, partial [Nitrospira sp.]|nr:hypothetical protein [Nitrospira sp.]